MLKVLVCGGRDYADAENVNRVLTELHTRMGVGQVIHGAARGADSLAAFWAKANGIPVLEFPANWSKHGRAAGPIRNAQMLEEGRPDWLVAFPGGAGTANMVKQARAAGVQISFG